MSEVKRYLWGATAIEHPQGTLVALADYAALQAVVRDLEEQLEMREQQAIVREPLIVGQQERIAQFVRRWGW